MDLAHEQPRVEDQDGTQDDQRDLSEQVGDSEKHVHPRRLADPADVEQGEDGDHRRAADHVAGPVAEWRADDEEPPASGNIEAPSAYVLAVRANRPPAKMKTRGVRPSACAATRPSA